MNTVPQDSAGKLVVILGADHGGYQLKQQIFHHLRAQGVICVDVGCDKPLSCDYPDYAALVAEQVLAGLEEPQSPAQKLGILVCGTGIGISIAANKIKGVRAALCHDSFSARYSRLHNDANIMALGARVIGEGLALELVDLFLSTPFEGGRHATRVGKIMQLEKD